MNMPDDLCKQKCLHYLLSSPYTHLVCIYVCKIYWEYNMILCYITYHLIHDSDKSSGFHRYQTLQGILKNRKVINCRWRLTLMGFVAWTLNYWIVRDPVVRLLPTTFASDHVTQIFTPVNVFMLLVSFKSNGFFSARKSLKQISVKIQILQLQHTILQRSADSEV